MLNEPIQSGLLTLVLRSVANKALKNPPNYSCTFKLQQSFLSSTNLKERIAGELKQAPSQLLDLSFFNFKLFFHAVRRLFDVTHTVNPIIFKSFKDSYF